MQATMKQATGSNAPRFTKRVSIQQALDGHSFSISGLDREFPGEEPVEVELLTPQTLLVPTELFAPDTAVELLAAAGMACTSKQRIVWSLPTTIAQDTEAVAVMALPQETLLRIRERLGERATFTTPLLEGPAAGNATVWLLRKGGVLYIKVFGRTLRMAEAIPARTDAEILYFIDRLGKVFPLKEMRLQLTGTSARSLRELLGKRFKKVVCAS